MRSITGPITALCGLGLALGGAPAAAQSPFPDVPAQPPAVLEVPYLPQSELLCGGAAVAMVERWWGRRGVYAEDFAAIVRPGLRGIRTVDLADAARARGWDTRAFDGTPEEVRRILGEGVPVVALIEVAPKRYHYVVLLGWSNGRVTYHDPARAPSRAVPEARFLKEWTGAERWAMVLRPEATGVRMSQAVDSMPDSLTATLRPAAQTPADADSMPCRPWLDRALDAADANRLEDAADLLEEAAEACPGEPLVVRELAGVRFKQRRLAEAARLSGEYLALAPADAHGWKLLAASRYLTGDREGALQAWNMVGLPEIDLIRIDGIRKTRFGVIADAMDLRHGTVLTPTRLALARRRIADLPASRRGAVDYQPVEGGRVEVHAVVSERPVVGPVWRLLAGNALRAATQREVGIAVATPTGAGELWTGVWRWEHAHPRVAARIDLPLHLGVSGVLGAEVLWERFRFSLDTGRTGVREETRRAGGISFGSWVIPAMRPFAGLRLERWSGSRQYLDFTTGAEIRAAGDRLVLAATGVYGRALASHPSYTRGDVRAMWASASGLGRPTWSARLGADLASLNAPLGVWPVASGDISWAIPLRAHPRTSDGLLPGATAGRAMLHGGLSGDHPVARVGPLTLALGLFVDGVEILHPADGTGRDRFYLDAGGGLRVGILDGLLGILRIDLATGLTDRRTALTVGMHQSWPPFQANTHSP